MALDVEKFKQLQEQKQNSDFIPPTQILEARELIIKQNKTENQIETLFIIASVTILIILILGITYFLKNKKNLSYSKIFAIYVSIICSIGIGIIFPILFLIIPLFVSLYIIFKK
jgi:hypothetical protein